MANKDVFAVYCREHEVAAFFVEGISDDGLIVEVGPFHITHRVSIAAWMNGRVEVAEQYPEDFRRE